jgi:hypothetical protein
MLAMPRAKHRSCLLVCSRRGLATLAFMFVLALALPACSEHAELLGVLRSDSGGSAGASAGGSTGQPRFGTPVPMTELNVPGFKEQDLTLTGDLLEIFFMSERSGSRELWTSTRTSRTGSWAAPRLVPELNSSLSEIKPSVSPDGLRIWFYSAREPAGIWSSSRATRGASWNAPGPVPGLAGDGIHDPALDEAELLMAVAALGPDTKAWDLYTTKRPTSADDWGELTVIPGVDSDDSEHDPCLVNGGRDLFFASTRAGNGDLYFGRRSSPDVAFTNLLPITDLNEADFSESDPFLSEDHTMFYYASTRSGITDMYEVSVTSYP